MKSYVPIMLTILILSCQQKKETDSSSTPDSSKQHTLFVQLYEMTTVKPNSSDSLAFLIIPLKSSCPSCLEKTIDSFVNYKDNLLPGHYIILSINGGRKTIRNYFRQYDHEMPNIGDKMIFDTTNLSFINNLDESNPTFYYTSNEKVYKKVASKPATIKKDLHEFFTGTKKK